MEIDLNSPQASAFAVMSYVKSYLKQTDRFSEWPDTQKQMMAGDYDDLCRIATKISHGFISFVDDRELGEVINDEYEE